MNISEKSETEAMHGTPFKTSNSVKGKVFHLLL